MHVQDSHWSSASAVAPGGAMSTAAGGAHGDAGRSAPLRVDAQRNLEHVLRAAREVFGELGYGAPMEDVARRARVGVGTVYRRFPSKDVLVRRIAEEETARLTDQARTALGQEDEPWSALSRFLRTSVASGAGRLLPPQVLRVGVSDDAGTDGGVGGPGAAAAGDPRVPQQRIQPGTGELRLVSEESAAARASAAVGVSAADAAGPVATSAAGPAAGAVAGSVAGTVVGDDGAAALLEVVGRLVERARTAGELRPDVSVSDVLLVIATAAPSLPDPAQQAAASARLLDILLEGLRSRPV
ncbi:TetR/AcrR family transcriptional regulator [Streptomyces lividans]|uniref:Transcriptional regulator, TetR family n=2 Tax=Streptomyces lividans TaxID=1916 RepID=A0A7U9HC73_STRLI|nr:MULTISPECIES: helix-turn-helix domain-containing protein [Streptomyces]EOY49060.1 Transcriptional regulator, TetR family [Streptomyces lividans 1326]KKD10115.1 TetR family transcriptional regulator [Streptomyces sp. WM6391]MBQ0954374.1 helix-turn-helix transcriptional regulator [Streptomyces sp. RK76]WSB61971.1 TetR/AcrR family transcriptional regulator [Streptomyces anthocyanicus]